MKAALFLLACCVIVAATQFQLIALGQATGLPLDPDGWTRLLRVRELWRTGEWFQHLVPALSAPEGMSLHWTRPLDLPILGGAWIAVHGFGAAPEQAILLAGALVCPILYALVACTVGWAARIAWPDQPLAPWFAVMALIGNGALKAYATLGRADHHVLIALGATLGVACALRAVDEPGRPRMAFAAGLSFGLGLWVGPETLIVALPVAAMFGALWVLTRDAAAAARRGAALCLGMAATTAVAIVVERPPADWLATEYDRISAHHLVLALLMAGVFLAARRGAGLAVPGRTALGAALAAGAAGLLLLAYPTMFGRLNGVLVALPSIQELAPIGFGTAEAWRDALVFVGIAPAALLGVAALAWTGRWRQAAMLLAPLLMCIAATLMVRRFGALLGPIAAIGAAGLVGLAANCRVPALPRVALMLGALALLAPSALAMLVPVPAEGGEAGAEGCDPASLARGLGVAAEGADGGAPIVLTSDPNVTPELAWRTPLRFVAAPYHRGQSALADTAAFFDAGDAAEAEAVVRRRGISYVLLCPGSWQSDGAFARQLSEGRAPAWLERVAMPGEAGRQAMLWRVR